jgi:hypothetical protein
MRTRLLTAGTAMALALGLLTATPATAAYAATISFPGGNTEFYSPFGGPASIQFDFDAGDPSQVFRVRVRPVGGAAFVIRYFSVNPSTQTSPQIRQVSWDGLVTSSDKPYEVLVNPDGQPNIAVASFILRPRLVSITSVSPNPFYPRIDDLYKDETHVRFALAADAAAEARVYRPKTTGKCCGALVRNDDLGALPVGDTTWDWDGRDDSGADLAKGDYFVRIRADDGSVAPTLSKAAKVTIARVYRATKTKSKTANAYHHVGPVTSLVIGGGCIVFRTAEDRLQILCQGGRVSVYWRWGLASSERIERASFVRDDLPGCPRSIWSTGHTKHESSFTMNEDLVDAGGNCYLITARITYSYPKQS